MAARYSNTGLGILSRDTEPLIGIFVEDDEPDSIRYFTSEQEAEAANSEDSAQSALELAGAWRDLEWESMQSELNRIRHESPPSPPISL